jgi:hypothetical protein
MKTKSFVVISFKSGEQDERLVQNRHVDPGRRAGGRPDGGLCRTH